MTVTAVEISERGPYAAGRKFAGRTFERLRGRIRYAVDPGGWPQIVDLEHAPRNAAGQVEFAGDFVCVRPLGEPAATVVLDVPNRGRPVSFGQFNRVPRAEVLNTPTAEGDGFLCRAGLAVLSVGWQCDLLPESGLGLQAPRADGLTGEVISRVQPAGDMPSLFHGQFGARLYEPADLQDPDARLYRSEHPNAPLEPIPRERWRFARQRRGSDSPEPDPRFIWCEDGFNAGMRYTLVYRARDPFVVGCGLLAVRDAALALRGNSELGGHRHVLAFGVSQTGRFLRHFLSLGLNPNPNPNPNPNSIPNSIPNGGGRVLDGALIHIAGAQRGDFNHRFAQPGSLGVSSLGQEPPFDLPADAAETPAKVMVTNTSWEYWRGDAGLAHLHCQRQGEAVVAADRKLAAHERVWLLAGTHHIGAVWPPASELVDLGLKMATTLNMVDPGPLLRAALVNLDRWVSGAGEPPPSAMPRLADGSAVTRAEVLAAFADGPHLDPAKLPALRDLDLGPAARDGLPAYPAISGAAWPALVSAVDRDGNEIAGIRLPDVSVPVGVHSGWNPRAADCGAADQPAMFAGFSRLLPAAVVRARYADRAHYEARVREAAAELITQGYLLADDLELVVGNCLRQFNLVSEEESA